MLCVVSSDGGNDHPDNGQGAQNYPTMLFDENDACHLALGRGIPSCIEGGEAMSRDEQVAAFINFSDLHVDFVVGSTDLDLYGVTTSGDEEPLLLQGDCAFEA